MPDQAPQMPVDIMPLLAAAAGIVLLLVLVRAVQRALRRRRRFRDRIEPTLAIDISQLSQQGPPATGPLLTFYHLPVRLAAIVLAPAGRAGTLPAAEGMPQLLDAIVPGLAEVVAAHEPLRLRWPEQLAPPGSPTLSSSTHACPERRGKARRGPRSPGWPRPTRAPQWSQ